MSDSVLTSKPILDRFRLNGRTALVTGAGSGIGRGYAHALGEAGAAVEVADMVGGSGESGAQEVDLVLPYTHLLTGDELAVERLLEAVRKACPGLLLKVILETGELKEARWIERACRISLDAGADFLKTSAPRIRPQR